MLQSVPLLTKRGRQMLWLDAGAGALAGVLLLAFRDSLAAWFGFAVELVSFNAIANLAYASYSGTLAALTALDIAPPRRSLTLLVIANAAWIIVCIGILSQVWTSGTALGRGYLALEAMFVGTLAFAEYRAFRAVTRP
jgi:hypothetical protein